VPHNYNLRTFRGFALFISEKNFLCLKTVFFQSKVREIKLTFCFIFEKLKADLVIRPEKRQEARSRTGAPNLKTAGNWERT
jgi:hypothetical protein